MLTITSKQSTVSTPISLTQRGKRCLRLLSGGITLGLSLSLLASPEAKAATFNFTKIADSGSSFDTFGGFSLNNRGTVAFEASLDEGGAGIFTSDGNNFTSIAQTDNSFKSFPSRPDINDSGTVAFDAVLDTGVTSIFTGNGSTTTPIAIGTPGIPYPPFFTGYGSPSINNAGTVAYIRIGLMDVHIVTTSGRSFGGGTLTRYLSPVINDQGVVAYGITGLFRNGIETSNGTVTIGVNDYPISVYNFDGKLSINNAGTVAFIGLNRSQGILGIYKTNGKAITTVVQGYPNISYLSNPSINNNDTVAFLANLSGGKVGIFTGADPLNDQVIATGDLLFDSKVTELAFSGKGFNDAGQVAFLAKFADGTSGIFRADPVSTPKSVPEPDSGLATLLLSTLALGAVVKRRRQF